jgi:hypothetical protein
LMLAVTLWLGLAAQASRAQEPVDFASVDAFLKL